MWQCITDATFEPLGGHGGMEVLELHAAIERILQRAEKNDRQIIAWSNHELDIVRAHCPDLVERFESRYVNARTFAEYWRNKCHAGDKPDVATLASYLGLIGYDVPPEVGPGLVGETIRRVRKSLGRARARGVSADQLRRWEPSASTTATTASGCARSASRPPRRSKPWKLGSRRARRSSLRQKRRRERTRDRAEQHNPPDVVRRELFGSLRECPCKRSPPRDDGDTPNARRAPGQFGSMDAEEGSDLRSLSPAAMRTCSGRRRLRGEPARGSWSDADQPR